MNYPPDIPINELLSTSGELADQLNDHPIVFSGQCIGPGVNQTDTWKSYYDSHLGNPSWFATRLGRHQSKHIPNGHQEHAYLMAEARGEPYGLYSPIMKGLGRIVVPEVVLVEPINTKNGQMQYGNAIRSIGYRPAGHVSPSALNEPAMAMYYGIVTFEERQAYIRYLMGKNAEQRPGVAQSAGVIAPASVVESWTDKIEDDPRLARDLILIAIARIANAHSQARGVDVSSSLLMPNYAGIEEEISTKPSRSLIRRGLVNNYVEYPQTTADD